MPDHTILFDLPLKKERKRKIYTKSVVINFLKFYHTTSIQGQDYILLLDKKERKVYATNSHWANYFKNKHHTIISEKKRTIFLFV